MDQAAPGRWTASWATAEAVRDGGTAWPTCLCAVPLPGTATDVMPPASPPLEDGQPRSRIENPHRRRGSAGRWAARTPFGQAARRCGCPGAGTGERDTSFARIEPSATGPPAQGRDAARAPVGVARPPFPPFPAPAIMQLGAERCVAGGCMIGYPPMRTLLLSCLVLLLGCSTTPTVSSEQWSLHEAAYGGDVAALRRMLEGGANPNSRNRYRETPLHMACYGRHPEAVTVLLAAGANVHSDHGADPLHIAVNLDEPQIVRLLVNVGADPRRRTAGGKTARDLAHNGDVLSLLDGWRDNPLLERTGRER